MTRIAITGANGFVGQFLTHELSIIKKFEIIGLTRSRPANSIASAIYLQVGDLSAQTDWTSCLNSVDVLVHLAARVHVMNENASDPLTEFRRVNVEGTLHLARQAASAGVRRFIFISSVKVNGESTSPNSPFTTSSTPAPLDPYGVSKMEAENGLRSLAETSGMDVVIIRPPLVYGPGVKANFANMMRWLARGVPLPLGGINNRRSLVSIYNLTDLIRVCITHPAAANQTLFVSDGEDLSTTDLLKRLADALGGPTRLFTIRPSILMTGARLIGKRDIAHRIFSSLQVDITHSRTLLEWTPPVSTNDALKITAQYFLKQSM